MEFQALQIGELARRTGLSVRALRHYDEIGLLRPSMHTEAGYRLYLAADVARLQAILSLRKLGFSLEEIRACLDRPDFAPLDVVRLHLAKLRERIDLQQKLFRRLESIAARFQASEEVSGDEFLQTIEEMIVADDYFTREQQEEIEARRRELGEETLRRQQEEWADLIAEIRAAIEAGANPRDPVAQRLAQRWSEKVRETTGGDPEIERSLRRLWDDCGDQLAAQFGPQYDPRPVFGFMEQAAGART